MYTIFKSNLTNMYRIKHNNVLLPIRFSTLQKAQQYVSRRTNK